MDEKADLLQRIPLDIRKIIYSFLDIHSFVFLTLTSKKYFLEIDEIYKIHTKFLNQFRIDFPYLLDSINQFDEGFIHVGHIWWNLKSQLDAKLSHFEKAVVQTTLKYKPKDSVIHSKEFQKLINKCELITEKFREKEWYQHGNFYTYNLTNYLGLLGYWNVMFLLYQDDLVHCNSDSISGGIDWLFRMRRREELIQYLRITPLNEANGDDAYMTPLNVAIKLNYRDGVLLLLQYGALPQYEDKVDCYEHEIFSYKTSSIEFKKPAKKIPNPLHVAAQYGHFFPELLSYHILDLNRLNSKGETAVTVAVRMGRMDFINKMLEQTLHPQLVNLNCGDILPLHTAVEKNYYNIACLLLDHGANPHQRDKAGFTALGYAYKFGRTKMILKLKEHGATNYFKIGINSYSFYLFHSVKRKLIQELDEIPLVSSEKIKKYQANLQTPWAKSPNDVKEPFDTSGKSALEIEEANNAAKEARAMKTKQAAKAASEAIDIIYKVVSPRKGYLEVLYKKDNDPLLVAIRSEIENFKNGNLLISDSKKFLDELIKMISGWENKSLKVEKVFELMIGLRKKLDNDINHQALEKFICM